MTECPINKGSLAPFCTCNNNRISCSGNETIDLANIFHSLNLTEDQKHFSLFELNNTAIYELEENTFKDITFDQIVIQNCFNLTKIGKNAFNRTTLYTTSITIVNNRQLSQSDDNSLFEAMSRFVNIKEITIRGNNIREIPSNAFHPINGYQNKLNSLTIVDNGIRKLGNNAFYYLKNLTYISLASNSIDYIPNNGFNFEKSSPNVLTLYLDDNPLNASSFADNWFSALQRPTLLNIGNVNQTDPQNIDYLNEKSFLPFLSANELNQIIFYYNNQIDCNDCRNYWIIKNPKFSANIKRIFCTNKKNITDSSNFKNCISFLKILLILFEFIKSLILINKVINDFNFLSIIYSI